MPRTGLHIVHKWTRWSEPKDEVYINPISAETYALMIQERTCKTCNKYQWRKV